MSTLGPEEVFVVALDGEIDIANSRSVGKELLEGIDNEALGLVVDLSSVSYVDSAGIRMLFELARTLSARRQHLLLVIPDGSPLLRLMSVTHVSSVAAICTTLMDARARLAELAEDAAG